jgi:hypothetical protein
LCLCPIHKGEEYGYEVLKVDDKMEAHKRHLECDELTSTRYGIRRKMLCHQEFMVAIMQTCCVCISSSLLLILSLLMNRTAQFLKSILNRVRMIGGAELGIC